MAGLSGHSGMLLVKNKLINQHLEPDFMLLEYMKQLIRDLNLPLPLLPVMLPLGQLPMPLSIPRNEPSFPNY